jgi:adenine-specific DNA methylase
MPQDVRVIEDYLPIEAISAEASREKSIRKGHISTLHLWWARRPLVACRAAVYGALVPASRFVPNGGSDEKKKSPGRANSAKFVKALCLYFGEPRHFRRRKGTSSSRSIKPVRFSKSSPGWQETSTSREGISTTPLREVGGIFGNATFAP